MVTQACPLAVGVGRLLGVVMVLGWLIDLMSLRIASNLVGSGNLAA